MCYAHGFSWPRISKYYFALVQNKFQTSPNHVGHAGFGLCRLLSQPMKITLGANQKSLLSGLVVQLAKIGFEESAVAPNEFRPMKITLGRQSRCRGNEKI